MLILSHLAIIPLVPPQLKFFTPTNTHSHLTSLFSCKTTWKNGLCRTVILSRVCISLMCLFYISVIFFVLIFFALVMKLYKSFSCSVFMFLHSPSRVQDTWGWMYIYVCLCVCAMYSAVMLVHQYTVFWDFTQNWLNLTLTKSVTWSHFDQSWQGALILFSSLKQTYIHTINTTMVIYSFKMYIRIFITNTKLLSEERFSLFFQKCLIIHLNLELV